MFGVQVLSNAHEAVYLARVVLGLSFFWIVVQSSGANDNRTPELAHFRDLSMRLLTISLVLVITSWICHDWNLPFLASASYHFSELSFSLMDMGFCFLYHLFLKLKRGNFTRVLYLSSGFILLTIVLDMKIRFTYIGNAIIAVYTLNLMKKINSVSEDLAQMAFVRTLWKVQVVLLLLNATIFTCSVFGHQVWGLKISVFVMTLFKYYLIDANLFNDFGVTFVNGEDHEAMHERRFPRAA
eukprot:TRINITY_DN7305_c0_g1_i1.p1 TRINITY_DN7305_c0_g1~~TRINITY_DN7305_c0_g1_i1.p1  ORF type:complete len:240 (-),score=61.59 TRINITY_DN7305_c0_g1_i1:92-811(-)